MANLSLGENQMGGEMRHDRSSAGALDYAPCRYGQSKLLCRGPRRSLNAPYVALFGDSITYGKFVPRPFPALVEQTLDRTCVNMGSMNAGIDSFLHDGDLISIANAAEVTVIQALGAQNLSNRFYKVHPRRNDRFLSASPLLQAIFPEVDFTEFNFTKHMLGRLLALSPERFEAVLNELQSAWLARMRLLTDTVRSPVILLWLRPGGVRGALGPEPLFVTEKMVEGLHDRVQSVIAVDLPGIGRAEDMEGMIFSEMDMPAALQMPGPLSHAQIAARLSETLREQM